MYLALELWLFDVGVDYCDDKIAYRVQSHVLLML